MATPNVRGAYELLRRAMQQQSVPQGVDFGSTPNASSDDGSKSYGSPQGGLLGRLLVLQAEQGQQQPFAGGNGRTPTDWPKWDHGETPRTRITIRPESALASSHLPDDGSKPAYSPFGADPAAQPDRSFFDRLQASWDHPHPHGLLTILKDTLNGMEQAVQGSIAATSTPTEQTEADVFRQNQMRELGPIGAWKAVRSLAPGAPRGAGGILARPLADAVRDGLPFLTRSPSIVGQGINEQIANKSVPAVRVLSRNPKVFATPQDPRYPENGIAAPSGMDRPAPVQAQSLPSGDDGRMPAPQSIPAQRAIRANGSGGGGIRIPPKGPSGGGGGGSDDGGDRTNPDFDIFRRCMRATKRNYQAWIDFCDDLPEGRKSRIDNRFLHGICQHKGYETEPHKKGWCRAEFGLD